MPTETAQLETPASVETLSAEIHALRVINAELQTQNQQLQHDVILLQRKLYGARTERQSTEEQQSLFADIAATEARLQAALREAQAQVSTGGDSEGNRSTRSSPPKGRRDVSQSTLPRVTVEVPDARLEAQGLKRTGVDTTYEIVGHKASYSVLVKNTIRYADTRPTAETATVSAQQPPRVCPKSLFHESVLAKVVTEKFGLGTTLYRLEKHMATHDVPMDRGTMSRHIEQIGNTLGATVVAAMFRHAKATAHVMSTDATGAWILPEPSQVKATSGARVAKRCSKGHFFTVVIDADAVLFFYERDHTQIAVQRLFEGYRGYLQADASSVYHLLEHGPPTVDGNEALITLVGCWAHCRRYFFEAAQCRYPQGLDGLLRVAAIFSADKPLWKLPAAERHAARARQVAPLVDSFFAWVREQRQAMPMAARNLASRALGYAANQEAELCRVLGDPHLPLDNTRAERALRTPVISRKNSLFHGSDTHAEAAAAIFSLLQTCRLHQIDPQSYFEEVLRLLPQWPNDRYLELAPNFWRDTRARIPPGQLASPLCWFSIPEPIATASA